MHKTPAPRQTRGGGFIMPSRGLEPLLRDPQSRVLSIERRGQNFNKIEIIRGISLREISQHIEVDKKYKKDTLL